jgi:hypothetical protein
MSDDNRGLEHTLMNTTDAMVWAEEFCRIFNGKVISMTEDDGGVDAGTMVGWFANAMQVAINMKERRDRIEEEQAPLGAVPETVREAFVEGVEEGRGEERTRPSDLDDPTS